MNIFEAGFLIFGVITAICIIATIVIAVRSLKQNPKELAYHEAGHVVLFLALNRRFKMVTIAGDGKNSLGHVEGDSANHGTTDKAMNLDLIRIALAGVKSTQMFMRGNFSHQGSSDYSMVENIINANPFLLEGFVSGEALVKSLGFETADILTKNKAVVKKIADELLVHKTLTADEVFDLVGIEVS